MMDYTILTIEIQRPYTLRETQLMHIEDAIAEILHCDEEEVKVTDQDIVNW